MAHSLQRLKSRSSVCPKTEQEFTMTHFIRSFLRNESGATSIEYGMIAVLISVGMLIALTSISGNVGILYALIVGAF
jgi:pilus assembly protein Flp/PilA